MASAAFRSSTRRTSGIGAAPEDACSANKSGARAPAHHRRTRSLSRCSGRFPPAEPTDELAPAPTPRRRFVNTARGGEFPEVSLDDLANEFFPTVDWELQEAASRGRTGGRAGRRASDAGFAMETESSKRRGRSVSRKGTLDSSESSAEKSGADASARRRRSLSVARCRSSDFEGTFDCHSFNEPNRLVMHGSKNNEQSSFRTPPLNPALRKSLSTKDLQLSQESYLSQSSSLTDEEGSSSFLTRRGPEKIIRTGQSSSLTDEEGSSSFLTRRGPEKTIRTVCAQKKIEHPSEDGEVNGFYDAMRREVRHAVEEIRTELERPMQAMVTRKTSVVTAGGDIEDNSDAIQTIMDKRRNYATELEESEKRKQQLLAELIAEEHRGLELTKMVREMLPEPKQTKHERPSRARKRSTEKTRMSKRLTEEAEKYIEDFIFNVEDTDLSSFDGERSDTSSTFGGTRKITDGPILSEIAELPGVFGKTTSLSTETDGVILPWLQWETATDGTPESKSKLFALSTKVETSCRKEQEASPCYDSSHIFTSSYGSCSPKCIEFSGSSRGVKDSGFDEIRSYINSLAESRPKRSSFPVDDCFNSSPEELLFDAFRYRRRIDSGDLILCRGSCHQFWF